MADSLNLLGVQVGTGSLNEFTHSLGFPAGAYCGAAFERSGLARISHGLSTAEP